jgi:hypothetical protein
MMIISDTTVWSITYDRHSDESRGVTYDHNIFIVQTTGANVIKVRGLTFVVRSRAYPKVVYLNGASLRYASKDMKSLN